MGRYDSFIQQNFQVVERTGDEFICRCHWHDDRGKPNLYVNSTKGVYICHSCGKRGHLSQLGATPVSSTRGIRHRLSKMSEQQPEQRYYPESWLRQFAFPHPAWDERGFSAPTIAQFELGYDPIKDTLTIPLRNAQGAILGVIRRRLDDGRPKYLDPTGVKKGKYLYGAWQIKPHQHRVALVEGPLDAVACWDARVPALALMGARLTYDQSKVLYRLGIRHVVLMTDNDKPGRDALYQIKDMVKESLVVSVGTYRSYWSAKDPGELNPQQRRKMFHSAKKWHEWLGDRL